MREFLKGLELDKETIDTIMAEHGKLVTESKEELTELKVKIKTYESQIAELEKNAGDSKKIQEELEKIKKSKEEEETNRRVKEEDEVLTNNIKSVFGDKKFVNSYTENSLVNEIKTALKDKANIGKSAKDLFEELTKDKEGIFTNPNQPKDMPGVNQNISTNVTKEAFEKMGYRERVTLKQENPELYQSFIK